MAELSLADMLRGAGAALGGRFPQFQQQMAQQESARQQAMYQDAYAAQQLLGQGDYAGVISLGLDRMNILNRMGIDSTDTKGMVTIAQAARAGNQQAATELRGMIDSLVNRGKAMGVLTEPQEEAYTLSPGQVRMRGSEMIGRGPAKEQVRQLSAQEVAAIPNLDPNRAYQIDSEGRITAIGGAGQNINVNTAQQKLPMYVEGAIKQIQDDASIATSAINLAQQAEMAVNLVNAGDTNRFGRYVRANYPEIATMFDESGLETAGVALLNRLTPQMRETGSGSTSDIEIAMFKQALPSVLADPNGRNLVVEIYKAKAEHEQKLLDLQGRLYDGEITEAEYARERAKWRKEPLITDAVKNRINAVVPGTFVTTTMETFADWVTPKQGSGITPRQP